MSRNLLQHLYVLPVLTILFLLSPVTTSWAYEDNLLSIYNDVLKTDPLLAKARAGVKTAKAEKPLARSRLLPRLTASGAINRSYTKVEGIEPDTVRKYYWGGNYSVRLVQPVFDGQAWVSLKIAQDIMDAEQASLISVEQELALRTFEAYFNLLHAGANVRVAEKEKELLHSILKQSEEMLEAGAGDITAVKEAQARYDASVSGLIVEKNIFSIAKQRLERLVHRKVGNISDLKSITPMPPDPDNMEEWVKSALDNQPVLINTRSMLEAARKKIEYARRERWPRLDLQAGGGYMNGGYFPEMRNTHTEAGIVLTMPIFLGGSVAAKTAKAESEAIETKNQLDYLKDQVTINAQSAFLRLKDSVARYNAAKQAMESATVSMEATNAGYRLGTRTLIDSLDMTQYSFSKRRDFLVALYDHILARARLKAAAGVIGENDIKAVNSILESDSENVKKEGKE